MILNKVYNTEATKVAIAAPLIPNIGMKIVLRIMATIINNTPNTIQLYDEPLSGLHHESCNYITTLWKDLKKDPTYKVLGRIFSMHGEHTTKMNWTKEYQLKGNSMSKITHLKEKIYNE